jgi:Holliday junction resolvasome RuvABC endonuclease subunit
MSKSVYVCGIDPSSKKLVAVITTLTSFRPEVHVVALPEGPPNRQRACTLADKWLSALLYDYEDNLHIFLEEPVLGRGGAKATIPQSQVNGALLASAGRLDVVVHPVNNARWKKEVIGNGNASKERIAKVMGERWSELRAIAKGDQDVFDAGAINRYGVHVLGVQRHMRTRRLKRRVG